MLVVGGCSFAFTNAPGPALPGELPVCTTTGATIAGDAIGSLPPLAIAGVMAYAIATHPGDNSVAVWIGAPALALGVVLIAAAVYGHHNVAACQDAIDAAMLALVRDADAGNCDPVVAFAKHLAHRDPDTAMLFIKDATFARCFN
jgi:hypothetical protein